MIRVYGVLLFGFLALFSCKLMQQPEPTKALGRTRPTTNTEISSTEMAEYQRPVSKDGTSSSTPNCYSKEIFEKNQVACGKNEELVCGCNSVTYLNECEAKKAGLKGFKKGKCDKEASDI